MAWCTGAPASARGSRARARACFSAKSRAASTSTSAAMPDIIALGEPLLEFNQARSTDPTSYVQGFGGDTSNMAIAAARLGARVGYVTRLGSDAFGRMFLDLWARENIDTSGV